MKRSIHVCLLLISICILSCKSEEEFSSGLKLENINSLVQTYKFDLDQPPCSLTFETEAGCEFIISKNGFLLEGRRVFGEIEIDIIEIFDKGTMAITGKHTMADESLLISGGEFFINARQGNRNLDFKYSYKVNIPVDLTGGFSNNMQLFTGGENLNSAQDWLSVPNVSDTWGVFNSREQGGFPDEYSIVLQDFQWFNCDKFFEDPRPTTELDLSLPSQFDNNNSIIYLAIKGEPSSLGNARRGKYPIGLDVHLIFMAEMNDEFLYQIISEQVSENEYKFDRDKMQTVSPEVMKDIINALE